MDRPHLQAQLDALATDIRTCSDAQLIEFATRTEKLGQELTTRRFAKYFLPGLCHERILTYCVNRSTNSAQRQSRYDALLSGVLHRTAQMNEAINALAQLAAGDLEIAQAILSSAPETALSTLRSTRRAASFLGEFSSFMSSYGVRCSRGMIPVPSCPTWADHPEIAIGMLQSILRSGAHLRAQSNLLRQSQRAEDAKQQAVKDITAGSWLVRFHLRLFRGSLKQARYFVMVREESLYLGEQIVAESRRIIQEIGSRLQERNALAKKSSVQFLRLGELAPALQGVLSAPQLEALVRVRQAQFATWTRASATGGDWLDLALGRGPGRRALSSQAKDGTGLQGLAASAGKARGRVKVVLEQDELWKVDAGDILVCRATAPAWTAVFGIAAGIVTDIGGVLSHAAIVAREYQIPAVLGTGDATRRLHDGTEVVVDGDSGRITILG